MIRLFATSLTALVLAACASTQPPVADISSRWAPQPYVQVDHPDWADDAVLYQLNTRQFTEEGTFAAAELELDRLADLGVDIIWLMPIHPIGEMNRKGSLGSPYSVRDYYGVNPEFGTLEDLKSFVDAAHERGMHVILDWVANHTAWDNPLVEQHPDWYERDWDGDFMPTRWWDWSDIIDLDYSHPELREYMAGAMRYWVEEVGIDGYRADVAGYIPLDFWEEVRAELDSVKPVFMLGEFDQRDIHRRAFDASYAWEWKNIMHAIGKGEAKANALFGYYSGNESVWPHDAYRMTYTANHDQNSWDAAAPDFYGPAYESAIVLSFVGEGIPLIYNGQEAFNEKQLEFFEKDPIQWRDHPIENLFRALIELKTETTALHNGAAGARMVPVVNTAPEDVLSFSRMDENGGVLAVMNLSPRDQVVQFTDGPYAGQYTEYFSGERAVLDAETELDLPAWSYRIYVR
ncbi:alpha-amlyase [Henriciella mobilis]|uniref:alpha-amylase family glycosyl hydrolase n=1 Tax=Henriciella mobilis TaxID=2305467 RepID=UPI000E666B5F|nr:alpha-amylase family glycosyl hydrolase [Henriciella mobilis]RIJ16826.1 alpha-amlyase [Henriciella mobilis]RIJ19393.1 alpha-amlyase [Henriciella mobilis]